MSEEHMRVWDRMHDYLCIKRRIFADPILTKLPKAERTVIARAEYQKRYGKPYRRPGVAFNW